MCCWQYNRHLLHFLFLLIFGYYSRNRKGKVSFICIVRITIVTCHARLCSHFEYSWSVSGHYIIRFLNEKFPVDCPMTQKIDGRILFGTKIIVQNQIGVWKIRKCMWLNIFVSYRSFLVWFPWTRLRISQVSLTVHIVYTRTRITRLACSTKLLLDEWGLICSSKTVSPLFDSCILSDILILWQKE